jgi:predicted RNA-binding Zn ribbon-like protein
MSQEVNPEDRAFEPISGHRALDLLATLRDRHHEPTECLNAPADLDRWLAAVQLKPDRGASETDLEAARRLRETIDRLARATLNAEQPPIADLRVLNAWARRPPLAPQIASGFEHRWSGGVEAALVTIAREAVELLTTSQRTLIRECAATPKCSRIYLDRSPGHRRRWCHMQWCGSSAKMRSYRRRRASTASRI